MSLALEAGTHPGQHEPAFDLGADEVELGVGIHGERGTGRVPFASADELTEQLVDPLLGDLGSSAGLGARHRQRARSTYPLELVVAARGDASAIAARGISRRPDPRRSYVTSLDMHGLSVT